MEHTVNVDAMLDRMDPRQFEEWFAEYSIEPWGIEFAGEPEDKPSSLAAFRGLAGV